MFNFFFPESCTVWSIPGKMKFPRSVPFFWNWHSSWRCLRFAEGQQSLHRSLADLLVHKLVPVGCCSVSWGHRARIAPPMPLRRVLPSQRDCQSLFWVSLFAIQLSLIISSFNWHYYSLTYVLFWGGVCVCYILINVYVTLVFTWTALIYLLLALRTFYCFV